MGESPSLGAEFPARRRRWRARRLIRRARAARDLLTMKVVTTFYRRMVLLTYELQAGPIPTLSSRILVRYATLSAGDLEAYRRFRPHRRARDLEHDLARGDRCFVTWHEGRIIHECWVTTSPRACVPYLDCGIRLEAGDAYYYGAYTDAAFRGRGLFRGCYSFIARTLQQEGCRRSVALVAIENRRSVAVLERSGLTARGVYACLRVGRRRRHWAHPYAGHALLPLERSQPAPRGPASPGRPMAWT